VEQSDWRKRYHVLWYLTYDDSKIDFSDDEIEKMSENMIGLLLDAFGHLTHTENTVTDSGKIYNLRDLPKQANLLVPLWVMDRLKESMRLFVDGMYFAVIMLCGSIVEFVEDGLFNAYIDKLPANERIASKSVIANLNKMNKHCILSDADCKLLREVRGFRDTHTHLKVLREDPVKLRSDALTSILHLFDFFDEKNMTSKYGEYLSYLFEYSRS